MLWGHTIYSVIQELVQRIVVVHLGLAASLPYRAVSQVGAFGSSHVFLFVVLLKEYVQPCEPADPVTPVGQRRRPQRFPKLFIGLAVLSCIFGEATGRPISNFVRLWLLFGAVAWAAGLRFLLFLKLDKVAQSQSAPRRPMENMEHGRRSYLVIEKAELICHFLSPSTAHGWIPRLKVVNSA